MTGTEQENVRERLGYLGLVQKGAVKTQYVFILGKGHLPLLRHGYSYLWSEMGRKGWPMKRVSGVEAKRGGDPLDACV